MGGKSSLTPEIVATFTLVTFNDNLQNYSNRGSSAGGGGGFGGGGFGGGRGGGGGGILALLAGLIGRRFGLPGIIIAAVAVFFFSGGLNMFGGGGEQTQQPQQQGSGFEQCQTAQDANERDDCRVLGTAQSLDNYWAEALPANDNIQYKEPQLKLAEGQVSTGCGASNISQSGPFYCPADTTVYVSTPFYEQLKELGGSDGPFSQMYVTAHEFGHNIQNLQGNLGLSDYNNPGAESNAVKMELQADCYAGMWASHADKGDKAVLDPITEEQVQQAVDTARAIGDDAIQQSSGQQVDPDSWTHGSSEQRKELFLRGYQGGTMDSCRMDFQR